MITEKNKHTNDSHTVVKNPFIIRVLSYSSYINGRFMPVSRYKTRNHSNMNSIPNAPETQKTGKTQSFACCNFYLYLSCIAFANGVLATPHFVSSSRMRPDVCHPMIISLISVAKSLSPKATASPQGASSIVFNGIS
jgi:hypothetical protein